MFVLSRDVMSDAISVHSSVTNYLSLIYVYLSLILDSPLILDI